MLQRQRFSEKFSTTTKRFVAATCHRDMLRDSLLILPLTPLSKQKKAFYLSVNVFCTKVLIGDTIFKSPNGDETTILRGHPSHA